MGEFLFEMIGQFFMDWLLFERHQSRWVQAFQALGCSLFLLLLVVMIFAVTGLLW